MDKKTNNMKNAIILNGKIYKVEHTNNIAGLGPDPCILCDKTIRKKCEDANGNVIQPCRIFNKGHYLAHFKKVMPSKPNHK